MKGEENMTEKFIDDKIEHIESDIEKIQTKPKQIGLSISDNRYEFF